VFTNDSATTAKSIFLNIAPKVQSTGGEQGLLGLAFHPNYAANGYFYVNYTATDPERTVVARYKVSADPLVADGSSEKILLEFAQPFDNHNGGALAFGADGFLYIATGDGGSGGDPNGNGQNRSVLLGKILRINVDQTNGELNYSIPDDNPFKGNDDGYREEIFAYGMRNPWRISFDRTTNKLWVADVGQSTHEEIDIVENGKNYGWNTMEGKHCYSDDNCDQTGLTLPVWEYPRSEGISIIGGYVYRGAALAGLAGKYIYTDYGSKHVWALDASDINNPTNALLFDTDFSASSFGEDESKNLFIVGLNGKIYKIKKVQD